MEKPQGGAAVYMVAHWEGGRLPCCNGTCCERDKRLACFCAIEKCYWSERGCFDAEDMGAKTCVVREIDANFAVLIGQVQIF